MLKLIIFPKIHRKACILWKLENMCLTFKLFIIKGYILAPSVTIVSILNSPTNGLKSF